MAKLSSTQIYGDLQVDGEIKNKATTSTEGVVKLNDEVNSTSTTEGATANAVKKVNDTLSSHTTNTTSHITASERTTWNAKASTSVATTSANGLMSSTDKKKLDGLSTVATSGSYNDLLNKPSTFPPSSHTHDDRYYTETEIDTKFNAVGDYKVHPTITTTNDLPSGKWYINSSQNPTTDWYYIDCGTNPASSTHKYQRARYVFTDATYDRIQKDGVWQPWKQIAYTSSTVANADTVDGKHASDFVPITASCNKNWNWSGQSGQPNWLWGGNNGTDMYVYNPSNFNVANANSVGGIGVDGLGKYYRTNGSVDINDTNIKQFYGTCVQANSSAPSTDWWHIINVPHQDNNGYGGQLAIGYHGNAGLQVRSANGTSWGSWYDVIGNIENAKTVASKSVIKSVQRGVAEKGRDITVTISAVNLNKAIVLGGSTDSSGTDYNYHSKARFINSTTIQFTGYSAYQQPWQVIEFN